MKYRKGFISFLLALTMSLGTAVALTSCGSNKKDDSSSNQTQQFDDLGEYYCVVGESEWSLEVTGDQFILTVDGQAKNGVYTFDGETLNVTFTDGKIATATVAGSVMSLSYDGATYKFYKKVNYTVTFDAQGGSAVESSSVINGKSVAKPADPTKDGFVFIGWYEDSTFKTPYAFAKPVTSDMKLYARFVKSPTNPAEFTVKFVVDGSEAFEPLTTKDGVIYNAELPTPEKAGAEFLGWWTSDFEDENKLTAKYTEQVLGEHTTLYAVWADEKAKISVSEEEISWTAEGVNNSYKVVVKNAAGEELLSRNTSTPKVAFDFTQQAAGEYTVEVSFSGKSATAYYNNKALDKVCVFDVTDSTITFNAVANAEKYLITVDCANDDHQHTDLDIGTSTYYNFDACDMQVGGIKFTVKAVAAGYTTSTSETYSVERTLNQVTDLTVEDATETAKWTAVENATAYVVKVENAGNVIENTVTETSYSLKGMTGEIIVSVYPMGKGFNPAESVSYTYTNTRLAAPSGLKLVGQSIAWDETAGATKYNVKIGANTFEATTNSLALTDEHFPDGLDSYAVSVQAVASDATKNSLYSDEITVNCNKMSDTLTYNNSTVVWDYVLGASKYGVKVNDGEETFVDGAVNSAQITLTQAGENTVYVRSYDATGKATTWVSVKVTAYTITFETEGEAVAAMYKANGDAYVLPTEAIRDGYNFAGWYDIANGPENNGTRITEGVMDGDITVYAGWASEKYVVNFDLGEYGAMSETESSVYYAKDYVLPTPSVAELTKAFAGWYTQPYGEGFRYTDFTGASLDSWKDLEGRTLYAHYVDIFTFTLNEDDDNKSYSITKGAGISMVTSITIPAYYNDKPVTRIESKAFTSCSTLTEIKVPDTVTTIVMPNGGSGTGSAFYLCSNLKDVEMYCACPDGDHRKSESRYTSVDGVLYYNSEYSGMSLAYFPLGRTGSFTIPSEITTMSGETVALTTIPTYTFRNTLLTEIVIPASVTKIEASAFYASGSTSAYLENIVFAPAAEGEEEVPVEIMDEAFYGQINLKDLSLPARMSNFSVNILKGLDYLESIEITGNGVGGVANYASAEGMLTNGDKTELVYVPRSKSGEFTINTPTISSIGAYALQNCDSLTSIRIPAFVTEIKEGAFYDCDYVETIIFEGVAEDATLNIRTKAFYGVGGATEGETALREINLPANIGIIEKYAFGNVGESDELLTINVVAGGSNFATAAFGTEASNPTYYVGTVNLGKDVEQFAVPSVFGAKYLSAVVVDPNNAHYTTIDNVLYDKDVTMIAYFPAGISEYEIPSTVTEIGASVFRERKELTKITIPASVASIGDYAFYYCNGLTEINFTDSGTAASELTIGTQAFYYCKSLTSLDLPERLTTIGTKAFHYCNTLASIEIPEKVTTIGDQAFMYCSTLREIHIPASVTQLGTTADIVNVFDSVAYFEKITVDAANTTYMSIDGVLYKKGENGEATALCLVPKCCVLPNNTLDIPKTVSSIYQKAMYQNQYVTKVTFSQGTEGDLTFGDSAFNYSNLTEIELPEGLTNISKNMFYNVDGLKKINIPTTVTKIQNSAFYECNGLEEITFSDRSNCSTTLEIVDGTYASNGAFYKLTSLKKLIFPANTTKIGNNAVIFDTGKTVLEEIYIPSSVTTIGKYAFYYCENVTSLTFEEGINIETVGDWAFYHFNSLKSVDLPDNLTFIGKYMFQYSGLEEVTIPASVTKIDSYSFTYSYSIGKITFEEGSCLQTIGSSAFYKTSIKEVSIPATVTMIDSSAFGYCSQLEKVTFETGEDGKMSLSEIDISAFTKTAIKEFYLPETTASTLTLGKNLFKNCLNLEKVTLNGQVSGIEEVFNACPALQTIVISDTNEFLTLDEAGNSIINGNAIEFVFGELPAKADFKDYGSYTLEKGVLYIKEGVEEINDRAFAHQTGIRRVNISSTVKKIGNYAFYNCVNLEKVTFTKTGDDSAFTSIGQYAFQNCSALKSIDMPSTTQSIGASAFRYCTSLKEITLPKSLNYDTANNNSYIFEYCSSLETVIFEEDSVIECLKPYMFSYCGSLKNITIPETVKCLGVADTKESSFFSGYVFQNCTSLESIHIPSQVTVINSGMFKGCTSLTTVTTGAPITKISTYAFQNCTSLKELDFSVENVTRIGASAFSNTAIEEISLPAAANIGNSVFEGCSNLVTASIPVAQYASSAYMQKLFYNCTSLKNVTLNDALTRIATYYFAGCTSLEEVKLPSALKTLDTYAFNGCSSLKSISFPDKLTSITNRCFENCTSLENINFNKVNAFQISVFAGCTSLKSVKVPKLTVINTDTFANCTSLTNVELTEGTKLSTRMFKGCTSLKEITVPTTSTATITELFRDCTSLEKVTLSASFKTIPNYTFSGCTNLKEVVCEGVVTSIGQYAFADCASLVEYVVPSTVTLIYNGAFSGCSSLEKITLGASVTTIYPSAFAGTAIETLDIPSTVKNIQASALNAMPALKTIHFNNDLYRNENGIIVDDENEIVCVLNTAQIEDGVLNVTDGYSLRAKALVGCPVVTKVVLGDSVILQDGYCYTSWFEGCEYIEEVVLPEGVVVISNNMFYNATSLKKVVLPSTLTTINQYAFKYCTSLEEIELPEGLTTLNNNVFQESGLKEITLPSSLESVGTNIFLDCVALETVTFPEDYKVAEITNSMFKGSGIKSIKIPDSVTTIVNFAFQNCVNLQSVEWSANLKEVKEKAFNNTGLVHVTVPATVETWGGSVFLDCLNLQSVEFEENSQADFSSTGSSMFSGCTALTSVKLAEDMSAVASGAFQNCTAVKEIYIPAGCIVASTTTFKGWTAEQTIYTPLSLRGVMVMWPEGWNNPINCTAKVVANYVPAEA